MNHFLFLSSREAMPHLSSLLGFVHHNLDALGRLPSPDGPVALGQGEHIHLPLSRSEDLTHVQIRGGQSLTAGKITFQFYNSTLNISTNKTHVLTFDAISNQLYWAMCSQAFALELTRTIQGLIALVDARKHEHRAQNPNSEGAKLLHTFMETWG